MNISDETKQKIETEFTEWTAVQYAGKTKEERQKMGQFFTPPVLSIRMLEKFDSVKDKDMLDPTAGAGGLLVASILAGANPERIYGIELDPKIAKICRIRLAIHGVLRHHIHVGNALEAGSYNFDPPKTSYSIKTCKDAGTTFVDVDIAQEGKTVSKSVPISIGRKANVNNIGAVHELIEKLVDKECAADSKTNKTINRLNKVFRKYGLSEL